MEKKQKKSPSKYSFKDYTNSKIDADIKNLSNKIEKLNYEINNNSLILEENKKKLNELQDEVIFLNNLKQKVIYINL